MIEQRNESASLLVVSKESATLRLLWSIKESSSWQLETAATGWDAMERMQSGMVPHLLILDLPQGDINGPHFLRWLRRFKTTLPVVLLCHSDDAQGREAARLGAGEILTRPFDEKQLEFVIRRHLALAEGGEPTIVGKNIEPLGQDLFFVSASLIMQKLRAQAALMAKTDVPVLILGESGAGKFTVASLIHKLSVRSGFKLIRINCAQMPESVLATELFGDESAGSARGRHGRLGRFSGNENGTIFLDEITMLPAALQSRLLQVLQYEDVRGSGNDAEAADVRILAASSVNIDVALSEKRLREDLYYRLSALTVHVPPLRQRKDEIPVLLGFFMHKLAKHYGLPPRRFSASIFDACQDYAWPGNLSELETFVKRYLVAGDQEPALGEIDPAEIDHLHARPSQDGEALNSVKLVSRKGSNPESLKSLIQGIKSEAEQGAIGAALRRTGWNRKAAARLLKVSYRTLLYKIEQYEMRAPEPYLSSVPGSSFSFYDEIKGNGKTG